MKLKTHLILAAIIMFPAMGSADNGIGAGFMKLGVGARQVGMGRTFAGIGDDVYALYWNPGAVGFIRRWQWALGYDQWLADTYQASFLYARQWHFLGSPKFTVGGGLLYFGMPDFDSTQDEDALVSANSFVGILTFGERLDWLTWPADIGRHISVGGSIKFIKSNLADFSATGMVADFGFMIKPARFQFDRGLGLFDFGIVTIGATFQNRNIRGLKYDQETTRVPSLTKVGAALNLGRHDGWNLLIAFDSGSYSGEERVNSIGAEVWWHQVIGARLGYEVNGTEVGNLALGAGLRVGTTGFTNLFFPMDDNEVRIDFANSQNDDIFEPTYRGSISHYPNGPEPFGMMFPANRQDFEQANIQLQWQPAEDPDHFDEVRYILMVDPDSSKLRKAREDLERGYEHFLASKWQDELAIVYPTGDVAVDTTIPGREFDYFWSVAALDKDNHLRMAHGSKEDMRKFTIKRPDLAVTDVRLSPLATITPKTDARQGTLEVVIKNKGNGQAKQCKLTFRGMNTADSTLPQAELDSLLKNAELLPESAVRFDIRDVPELKPGETRVLSFPWKTSYNGAYRFYAKADKDDQLDDERNKENNEAYATIFTIPKWNGEVIKIAARDTFKVVAARYNTIEIPLVPIVFFDSNSSVVGPEYEQFIAVPGALKVIAERLKKVKSARLHIRGFFDPFSDPNNPELAKQRAEAVREKLLGLGVNERQLTVIAAEHPGKRRIQRSPGDKTDERHINAENRRVELYVQEEEEREIFRPIEISVLDQIVKRGENSELPNLISKVIVPAGVNKWHIKIRHDGADIALFTNSQIVRKDTIDGVLIWKGRDGHKLVTLNRRFDCSVVVEDGQGRTFATEFDHFRVDEIKTIFKEHIFALFEFAEKETIFEFYRKERLNEFIDALAQYGPDVHIQFQGHTCSIGTEAFNKNLAGNRANELYSVLLELIRKRSEQDPQYSYWDLSHRVDPPVSLGEEQPLQYDMREQGTINFGDNNSPVGRNLNRRVMIFLYRNLHKKVVTK